MAGYAARRCPRAAATAGGVAHEDWTFDASDRLRARQQRRAGRVRRRIGFQHSAIAAEAERRDWELVEIVEDAGFSARDLKRPGIARALERLGRRRSRRARGREARSAQPVGCSTSPTVMESEPGAGLGTRRAGHRRGHDHAERRGDGERDGGVRAVRAAANRAADA